MTDFRTAEAEFKRQLNVFRALNESIVLCGRQDPSLPTEIAATPLPILQPGSQNTMAAATLVLLAAHFEEYVRQLIEEYAGALSANIAFIPPRDLEEVVDFYWSASQSMLARIKPKGNPNWATTAQPLAQRIIESQFYKIRLIFTHVRFANMTTTCVLKLCLCFVSAF
jgi:hypothetical protein